MDFTPEFARALLGANFKRNRAQNENAIEDWRGALTSCNFLDNSPIRIAVSKGRWVLTDGQHRLTAIAESEMRATLSVVFVEVDESLDYAAADSIQTRKRIDVVAKIIGSHEIPRMPTGIRSSFATACKVIAHDFVTRKRISTLDLVPLMSEWAKEMAQLVTWMQETGRSFADSAPFYMSGPLAVCLYLTRHNAEKAKEFWVKLLTGEMLTADDPRNRLRDFILKNRRDKKYYENAFVPTTAWCWNHFVKGEDIGVVQPQFNMPEII